MTCGVKGSCLALSADSTVWLVPTTRPTAQVRGTGRNEPFGTLLRGAG